MRHPLQISPLLFPLHDQAGLTTIGSTLDFYGTVRGKEKGVEIDGLNYSAYDEMALALFNRLVTELQDRHPVREVMVVHRIGFVPAGEPSIHLRVMSSHRAEGFAFATEFLNRMKEDVPIWKE